MWLPVFMAYAAERFGAQQLHGVIVLITTKTAHSEHEIQTYNSGKLVIERQTHYRS